MKLSLCTGSFIFVVSTGLLASPPARASESASDPPPKGTAFGEAGQLAIGGAGALSLEQSAPGANTRFTIAPSADFFVLRGLSVGAIVSYSHAAATGEPSFDSVWVGPRIGYNSELGDHFSFWPTASVSYGETWSGPSSHSQSLTVSGYAPLLYHPVPHFFLGFGPNFVTAVASSSSTPQGTTDNPLFTQYGLSFTAGGWVNL